MKKITFLLTMIFSLVLTNTFAQGSCATAVPLTPGTQQCGDTSSGADVYDNNACLGNYDGGDDYIFSYVATQTGETLTLDLTGVDGWTGFAMTDDCPDAGTYNCMGSATTTSAGDINFTSNPLTSGVTYYIHISTWPSPQNTAFCLDAVVNPAPSCLDPDTFVTTSVTTTSVDLSWNDPSGTQLDFEYVVQALGNGTPPAGSGVAISATSATGITAEVDTTPLAPATDYEAWVRADCGGGDYSAWVGPIYFTTLCVTTIAPFLESFEINTFPACWTQGGANPWEFGSNNGSTPTGFAAYGAANVPDHSLSGTGTFIGMDGSDNVDGDVSTLTTPMIDISGLTTPYLSYYVFSNNVDDAAQNELLVEFYDGAAWNTVETIQANLGADWVMYGVDLTAFTITGDVQARFTVTGTENGGDTFYNDILIDDVSIDEAPTCFAPTGLAVSNVTNNTVDITWNDGSGGTQFDFYYVIQPQSTGTAGITVENYYDYSSGVPFTATCTDISDCANTLLTPNTAYEVYVRDDCGGAWVGPITFRTLCVADNVPYNQNFESATVPNLPSCTTQQNVGSGNLWTVQNYPDYGFTTKALRYAWNGSNAANVWFYTNGINLVGGTTYRITYDYGGTGTFFPEKLKVAYGTSANAAAMTNLLADHPNVVNDTPVNNFVDFTPATSGVYYFGFNAYSIADQFYLFVDNILVDVALSNSDFDNSNFSAYPNPVKDIFNVSYSSEISAVRVLNLLGQEVISQEVNTTSTQIDMSQLSTGTYIVNVTVGDAIKVIKVVKQ